MHAPGELCCLVVLQGLKDTQRIRLELSPKLRVSDPGLGGGNGEKLP